MLTQVAVAVAAIVHTVQIHIGRLVADDKLPVAEMESMHQYSMRAER